MKLSSSSSQSAEGTATPAASESLSTWTSDPSAHQGDPIELITFLFLGGCAVAILAGWGIRIERFVSYWDSFESFVCAVMG